MASRAKDKPGLYFLPLRFEIEVFLAVDILGPFPARRAAVESKCHIALVDTLCRYRGNGCFCQLPHFGQSWRLPAIAFLFLSIVSPHHIAPAAEIRRAFSKVSGSVELDFGPGSDLL